MWAQQPSAATAGLRHYQAYLEVILAASCHHLPRVLNSKGHKLHGSWGCESAEVPAKQKQQQQSTCHTHQLPTRCQLLSPRECKRVLIMPAAHCQGSKHTVLSWPHSDVLFQHVY